MLDMIEKRRCLGSGWKLIDIVASGKSLLYPAHHCTQYSNISSRFKVLHGADVAVELAASYSVYLLW
jgi:hypothetical protein